MVTNKKKTVVFIGFGAFAQKRYKALVSEPDVEVIGFYDPGINVISPATLTRYSTLDELLQSQSDIAIISTPHYLHWELIKKCHDASIFPFCEKPFVTTSHDLDESIMNPGISFYMSSNLMHFPSFRLAERFIRHFTHKILEIEYSIGVSSPHKDSWRLDIKQSGGGSLIDNGVHLYRLFYQSFRKVTVKESFLTLKEGVEMESSIRAETDDIKVSFKTSWLHDLKGYSQLKVKTRNKNYLFFANNDEIHIEDSKGILISMRKVGSPSYSLNNEFRYFQKLLTSDELLLQDMKRSQKTMSVILKTINSSKD